MINGPMSFKYAVKRQEGFLDTLRKKDISVRPDWIVSLPEVNYQMAYSAVCRLLNNEIRPNAFSLSQTFLPPLSFVPLNALIFVFRRILLSSDLITWTSPS